MVRIKGTDRTGGRPAAAGHAENGHRAVGRAESNLVGRRWETVRRRGLVGPRSRWPWRGGRAWSDHPASARAVWCARWRRSLLGAEWRCSPPSANRTPADIPFHVVARLLRAATGVRGLDGPAARDRVRSRVPEADPEDLLLFDDLLGIADPDVELPKIDPDARRRRLTALVNAASLARQAPAVYVVEDAHWIDEVSESMLAEFLTVIPQTPSLVLVTYRPEYRGGVGSGARCTDHRPCAAE